MEIKKDIFEIGDLVVHKTMPTLVLIITSLDNATDQWGCSVNCRYYNKLTGLFCILRLHESEISKLLDLERHRK